MFSVRNSLIAAFSLLMAAQAGHACQNTYLYASDDGVNAYADAYTGDSTADGGTVDLNLNNPSQLVAHDYEEGLTYVAAHVSWPIDQYGNWLATADYQSFTGVGSWSQSKNFPFTVRPAISVSGGNTIWYFGGQNPSGYTTSAGLTSSGGNRTQWIVTYGTGKINLSTTSGTQTTVTSTSDIALQPNDAQVKAVVDNTDSIPVTFTRKTPFKAILSTHYHNCPNPGSWDDTFTYVVQDNFFASLPANVGVNENWTTDVVVDYSPNSWYRPNTTNGMTSSSSFVDEITVGFPFVPQPECGGTNYAIDHWGQEWRIGSQVSGYGRRIQTDTLARYNNHAEHQDVVSPNP
ncbi:MAG: hypothetical protein AUH86_03160 [Acidobacteria bacterium 13_1_40CM_4_58_4]|nr:MAG: hypothetical protein AUH86_03160 [Acidobacteria bacterium 13_1_40CM_4_58_4]